MVRTPKPFSDSMRLTCEDLHLRKGCWYDTLEIRWQSTAGVTYMGERYFLPDNVKISPLHKLLARHLFRHKATVTTSLVTIHGDRFVTSLSSESLTPIAVSDPAIQPSAPDSSPAVLKDSNEKDCTDVEGSTFRRMTPGRQSRRVELKRVDCCHCKQPNYM